MFLELGEKRSRVIAEVLKDYEDWRTYSLWDLATRSFWYYQTNCLCLAKSHRTIVVAHLFRGGKKMTESLSTSEMHTDHCREEEEFEGESDGKSEERSNADCASLSENNANESRSESVGKLPLRIRNTTACTPFFILSEMESFVLSFTADITNDLNVELSRVVCELESALERKPRPVEANNMLSERHPANLMNAESLQVRNYQYFYCNGGKAKTTKLFGPKVSFQQEGVETREKDLAVRRLSKLETFASYFWGGASGADSCCVVVIAQKNPTSLPSPRQYTLQTTTLLAFVVRRANQHPFHLRKNKTLNVCVCWFTRL